MDETHVEDMNGDQEAQMPALRTGICLPAVADEADTTRFGGLGVGMNTAAMSTFRPAVVSILHSAQMFEMSDGSKVADFVGRVIHTQRANAWWSKSIDESGGGSPPDCCSRDGRTLDPEWSSAPQAEDGKCATCPRNAYVRGEGRECKHMRRLHMLLEGCAVPARLTITISSFGAWDAYMRDLAGRGIPFPAIATRFGLEKGKREGYLYSVLVLAPELDSVVTDAEGQTIVAAIGKWTPVLERQAIDLAEYANGSAADDHAAGAPVEGIEGEPFDDQF